MGDYISPKPTSTQYCVLVEKPAYSPELNLCEQVCIGLTSLNTMESLKEWLYEPLREMFSDKINQ